MIEQSDPFISRNPASHRYVPAAWLKISGADARGFLQGQFTNDIAQVAPGRAVYGLWLDQKGKVLADSFVLPGPGAGEYWLMSYFSPAATIRDRLEAYIIADDVVVEDLTPAWSGAVLTGEPVEAWWRESVRPGLLFSGRRGAAPAWEWVFPREAADAVEALIAPFRKISAAEMERARIVAGVPAVPADIGPGELPNEGGLENSAISFTKGCYLGQEIMARLKSRGNVRHRLFQVAGTGPAPSVPGPLFQSGRRAGELRSAAPTEDGKGFVGLALLTVGGLDVAQPLATEAAGVPGLNIGRVLPLAGHPLTSAAT